MEKFEVEKKKMYDNEEHEKKQDINGKKKQLGGVRTMPFILANEICDRFAGAGFHANMITYLTQVLNLPLVEASNTLTNFGGTSSFTPLVGAFIADSLAGRFWTIIGGSIIYLLGMVAITTSAVLPQLRPPPCPSQTNCQEASNKQLSVLYIALLLTSLGTGGIRPCVLTFAADQLDMSKAKTESRSWNFFNWYYFCMGFASLLAATVVVYIQDNISWGWGLGIPTAAMALSLLAFVSGSSMYKKMKPRGSPYKVITAAFTKSTSDSDKPNLWRRLATLHRVEEVRTMLRLLPIWAAAILHVASHSHLGSFTVIQARSMNRHLSPSFQIPPASMSIFSTLTVLAGLPLYERLFVPAARRFTRHPNGLTCLQRMGVGFAINIAATIVSALIEIKRKSAAADQNLLDKPTAIISITVFWLVPQYCLHGLAEVFMSVAHMEFLYDQSPESMRSSAAALFWIAIGIGNYVGTLMVTLVHKYTAPTGNWLPDRNLNRGKLDYYYWLATVIQVVNLIYFVACAWFYKYKPTQEISADDGDVEFADVEKPLPSDDDAKGSGNVEMERKKTCSDSSAI